MTTAICIGNGEYRKSLDIKKLTVLGVTYGSNAIQRDHKVDFLTCCDKRMVQEALNNKYTGPIYTREDWMDNSFPENVKPFPAFTWEEDEKWKQSFHWGSGLHAVYLALTHGHKELIIVGHDFWGVGDNGRLHNNLYKGTDNYEDVDHHDIDPSFWIKQFELLAGKFPTIQFNFYQPNMWQHPSNIDYNWQDYNNILIKTYEELELRMELIEKYD
jgi:hypothetical protein